MCLVGSHCNFPDEIFNFFPFYYHFFSLEFCFTGGGVQGQRTDEKGQGMNGLKIHDMNNT